VAPTRVREERVGGDEETRLSALYINKFTFLRLLFPNVCAACDARNKRATADGRTAISSARRVCTLLDKKGAKRWIARQAAQPPARPRQSIADMQPARLARRTDCITCSPLASGADHDALATKEFTPFAPHLVFFLPARAPGIIMRSTCQVR
jgi:hypothetical protein